MLCNRVNGEVRPFSMAVVSGIDKILALNASEEEYVLKIKGQLISAQWESFIGSGEYQKEDQLKHISSAQRLSVD